ncbi:hypothetical protein G039_0334105 [Pseudomonas aeruginosa VRFPA01]|nr:hypothetical protein G039_0334105 [Pseudomonas aeruginosa VRFPA01]
MSGDSREGLRGPWLQAGRLAFLGLFAVTLLAALAWAFSNVRQVGPENRAVVPCAGLDQAPGDLLADPRAAAGDDRDLVRKTIHDGPPPSGLGETVTFVGKRPRLSRKAAIFGKRRDLCGADCRTAGMSPQRMSSFLAEKKNYR